MGCTLIFFILFLLWIGGWVGVQQPGPAWRSLVLDAPGASCSSCWQLQRPRVHRRRRICHPLRGSGPDLHRADRRLHLPAEQSDHQPRFLPQSTGPVLRRNRHGFPSRFSLVSPSPPPFSLSLVPSGAFCACSCPHRSPCSCPRTWASRWCTLGRSRTASSPKISCWDRTRSSARQCTRSAVLRAGGLPQE